MRANLKVFYSIIITLLFFLPATLIAELLPQATLFEFTKSGHLAHMEEEKRFNRILFEEIPK